jgi:integrase/recombinase XerD
VKALEVKRSDSQVERALLSLKLRGLSDASLSGYAVDVRHYVAFAREHELAVAHVSTLSAFRKHLLRKGVKPATVNRKLVAVKRTLVEYAKQAYDAGKAEVLRGVLRDVKPVKLGAGEKHVSRDKLISLGEAAALLAAMPERIRLVAEFLFQTGARVSEALGVKLSDIRNVNGHSEVLVVGKGLKARTLLVKTELLERCFRCYHGESKLEGQEFLFATRNGKPFHRTYIHREFLRASTRALGKRVSPHCARHSFATWTLAKTKKVKGVSEYLGHADVSTTLNLYIHERLEAEELLGDSKE